VRASGEVVNTRPEPLAGYKMRLIKDLQIEYGPNCSAAEDMLTAARNGCARYLKIE
jgi:hypothetical protein